MEIKLSQKMVGVRINNETQAHTLCHVTKMQIIIDVKSTH